MKIIVLVWLNLCCDVHFLANDSSAYGWTEEIIDFLRGDTSHIYGWMREALLSSDAPRIPLESEVEIKQPVSPDTCERGSLAVRHRERPRQQKSTYG